MPDPGAPKPRLLIMTGSRELDSDLHTWLDAGYSVATVDSARDLHAALATGPGTVLMVDSPATPLEIQLPELAAAALGKGWRVIRLAADTGHYDSRWDRGVIHLPLGVRPKVLLAAIKGLHRKRAGG